MEKMTVRDDFDFFDIVDDFREKPIVVLDDALLAEIFADDVEGKKDDSSMEYVSEIVEECNQDNLGFYQEYMTTLISFTKHYENVQLQYPGVYSTIKDDNEKREKLMKLAIRDCSIELLSKMVLASIYDKTYCFNSFIDTWCFFSTFKKNDKDASVLSDKIFDVGTMFNRLLGLAEDTLIDKQRAEKRAEESAKKRAIAKIKG